MADFTRMNNLEIDQEAIVDGGLTVEGCAVFHGGVELGEDVDMSQIPGWDAEKNQTLRNIKGKLCWISTAK